MDIRHIGVYVRDIDMVCDILKRLGFEEIYNKNEDIGHVVKFKIGNSKIEVIENSYSSLDTFHICIDGAIPDFMTKEYKFDIISYNPNNPNLLVDFVYIGDTIYFEFVRNKNDI